MPWPVKNLIHVRLEFVNLALQPDANVRQLCLEFWVLAQRWATSGYHRGIKLAGQAALADRSRRPQHSPRKTSAVVEERLVSLRRQHPAWGARKLRRRLRDLELRALPATSTVTGILHRHGLITPAGSQAAKPFPTVPSGHLRQLWQVDFKGHFPLRQGRCHPLCALDDHSRYNVLLAACADQQRARTVQGPSDPVLLELVWPARWSALGQRFALGQRRRR